MQFGAFVPTGTRLDLGDVPVAQQWDTIVDVARLAEECGFSSLWVFDHFHTYPVVTQESTWEPWTVMAGLAAATSTIRLGQMCTCISYRSPSYLAKIAACVDVISGGRLEFGIGAGWYEHEYLAYGYDFPPAAVRIAQLAETAHIVKAMWTKDEATYDGAHFRVDGAVCRPKPIQQPRPPLWIAGGGEQLTLRVIAEHADYSNHPGNIDDYARKVAVLREHCADIGRDATEITLSRNIDCLVARDEAELAAKSREWAARNRRHDTFEEWRSNALCGTPDQVAAQIHDNAAVGVGYLLVYFVDATWGDGMRVFGDEVLPRFR